MMPARKKAQTAFASAVLLLFLSALAGYFSIRGLRENEKWVIHTYEVRNALGDIDWAVLRAGRARTGFVTTQNADYLKQFDAAVADIPHYLRHLRELTRDNPMQQGLCSRLESLAAQRVDLLKQSIAAEKEAPLNDRQQTDFLRQNLPISTEMTSVGDSLRAEEQRLLDIRQRASHRSFIVMVITLTIGFILALELFAIHYRFLSTELEAREHAERSARESEESLRRLTGRLLRLQDAERRKFSRELHDSLGQYLVGIKMNLELYANQRKDIHLQEALELLDQAITETRTISHLLHPPLLDEAGLSSAAKWFVEGFAERSRIEISVDLPDDVSQLSKPMALGLFRILQEGLTNIHRHANSSKAEVQLKLFSGEVVLKIRDYGKGISPDLLNVFKKAGVKSGVGLAGMRERVRELGGQLTIQSCEPGTLISVAMPLSEADEPTAAAAQFGK
jgi:signal transduction histidine kinase